MLRCIIPGAKILTVELAQPRTFFTLVQTNSCLSKRMQLSIDQIRGCMLNISLLRKRTLEERWADLGVSHIRNRITPPLKPLLIYFGIDLDELQALRADRLASEITGLRPTAFTFGRS